MSHQYDAGKARGETEAMAQAKGHNKNADGVYQRHDGGTNKWSADPNQSPGTGDLPTDAILAEAKSDQRLLDIEEGKGPEGNLPRGQFGSRAEALAAAFLSYTGHADLDDAPEANVDVLFTLNQEGGRWSFSAVSEAKAARTRGWNFQHDPRTGALMAIDLDALAEAGVKSDGTSTYQPVTVRPGRVQLEEGTAKFGDSIDLGNGVTRQIYSVTVNGNTTYTTSDTKEDPAAPKASDVVEIDGGRLIPRGNGTWDFLADPKAPFSTSRRDVVDLPEQGGSLIKTSENQYQFVRDTFDPGRKVDATGREYLQQIDGRWTELAPRFEPELIRADGMNLFQQRSGQVSQLSTATMDDIITQALIDGDIDKAFAFQDFRDRPTAQETFDTALEFARSPADQRIISSIARGITPVQPPPEGTIQRVGPQPDFLVEAYQDFQRRTKAGRAPTEEEASTLSARAAAGQSPLTDTLQTRLEELKIENQQIKNEAISLKTQQDQQVFQQNNPTLFGGEDPGLTQFKIDLGLSSGSSMPESTKKSLQDLIAALPDERKQYGMSQVESIYNGELTAEQVIGNLRMFADPVAMAEADRGTPEDNWAKSLAAYPDLTRATFDLFGGVDLSQKTADQINVAAGSPAGHDFGASTVRSNIHTYLDPKTGERVPETFSTEFGWESPEQKSTREFNEKLLAATGDVGATLESLRSGAESYLSSNLGGYGSTQASSSPASTSTAGVNNFLNLTPDSPPITNTPLAATPDTAPVTTTNLSQPIVSATAPVHDKSLGTATNMEDFNALVASATANQQSTVTPKSPDPFGGGRGRMFGRAGGGTVQPGEMTVVGEQGPEIAMMPPGTHILPLGKATKQDIEAAQATGRAYQNGGIVFDDLAPGLQQLWRGRPITPPRGYLFQQGGLTMPSAQALQNLTPTVRESFYGMHGDIGISPADFRQELQTATPRGTRLPTSRMLPLGRRGVR